MPKRTKRAGQFVAQYTAVAECWTDVPEAEPRCRVRVAGHGEPRPLMVDAAGAVTFGPAPDRGAPDPIIDTYNDPPPDPPGRPSGEQAELYAAIRERRAPRKLPGGDGATPRPSRPAPAG